MTPTIVSPENLPLSLTINDVAKVLGISRGSAYELARRIDFPKIKVGRRIVIPRDAFLNWMNTQCYGDRG